MTFATSTLTLCRSALLVALVSLTLVVQTNGNSPQKPISRDTNAALRYLRAYAALRQAKGLPPSTAALIENYLTTTLDGAAAELVTAAEDGLRELHHGAALSHCDWAVSYQDGLAADTSHRGAARELIAVAGLRARLRFREGRPSEAVVDLFDAITLARHLSMDGSLASPLIANTLEQGPASLLARHLPQLGTADLRQVTAKYNSLPSGAKLTEALLSHEKISRDLLIRLVRSAHGRDDLLKRLATLSPFVSGGAAEFLAECGGTKDGILRNVEQLRPRYHRWARWFSLSPELFEKKYRAEAAELHKKNPVFRLLTPAADRARWAEAYRQTQRALLRAALAVQQNGVGALKRYPDPYNGQRFEHTIIEGGFRLRSRLKKDGNALAISVGMAGRSELSASQLNLSGAYNNRLNRTRLHAASP